MFSSVPFPTSSGSTGFRERRVLNVSATESFRAFITSGGWSKAAEIANLINQNADIKGIAKLKPENVDVLVLAVGGGGGGQKASQGYGGYPGCVNYRTIKLSDLPDTVNYVVGAGGLQSTAGGTSYFDNIRGVGGQPGGSLRNGYFFGLGLSLAMYPDVWSYGASGWADGAASPDGPGGGGNGLGSGVNNGGGGSMSSYDLTSPGGASAVRGSDARIGQLWSFGGGGGGIYNATPNNGGDGGNPGGGGGAASLRPGTGGRGEIRLQYSITI